MERPVRPIGFFDSGVGGISVLAEAMRLLPMEDFIYYGDTMHAPYGDKQPEEVLFYTHAAVDKLMHMGCKAIVIACNTATSAAAAPLRQALTLPIIGMEPALKPAAVLPGEGKILVLATRMTLSQPKFTGLMEQYGQEAVPVPCPGLMECVEDGEMGGQRVQNLLSEVLSPFLGGPVKAAVLGCTHYVFLRKAISAFLGPRVPLVDGNRGTVLQLKRRLEDAGLLRPDTGCQGKVQFQTSATNQAVEKMNVMLRLAMEQ